MVCRHCSKPVSDELSRCPHCGGALSGAEKSASGKAGGNPGRRKKYYCKRCKRYLLSRICPIHGLEDTVAIQSGDTPGGGASAFGASAKFDPEDEASIRKFALPSPEDQAASAPEEKAQPDTAGSSFVTEKDLLFDVLKEDREEPTDASPPTGAPPGGTDAPAPGEPFSRRYREEPPVTIPSREQPQADGKTSPTPRPATNGSSVVEEPFASSPRRQETLSRPSTQATAGTRSASPGKKAARPRTKPKPSRSRQIFMLALVAISVASLFGMMYFTTRSSESTVRASLISAAEELYEQGQYAEALQVYQKFQREYPDDPLNAQVVERIREIERIEREQLLVHRQADSLMQLARQAFDRRQIVSPRERSAFAYLTRVLKLAPDHAGARQLKQDMLQYLHDQANAAMAGEQYTRAIDYYKTILTIEPDDPNVLVEINRALKLKKVVEMLNSLSELAKTQDEVKKLQKEYYRLKSLITAERRKLEELNQRAERMRNAPTASPSAASASRATGRRSESSRPSGESANPPTTGAAPSSGSAESQNVEELLGIELVPAEEPSGSDLPPGVVEENLIDGGKKVYIHREKPFVPKDLKGDELVMILAECIVGEDGKVEQVKLLSPADKPELNRIAIDAFKKYRYQPATYKGKPVKFKAIEVLSF